MGDLNIGHLVIGKIGRGKSFGRPSEGTREEKYNGEKNSSEIAISALAAGMVERVGISHAHGERGHGTVIQKWKKLRGPCHAFIPDA
jgi:hypothetical protein